MSPIDHRRVLLDVPSGRKNGHWAGRLAKLIDEGLRSSRHRRATCGPGRVGTSCAVRERNGLSGRVWLVKQRIVLAFVRDEYPETIAPCVRPDWLHDCTVSHRQRETSDHLRRHTVLIVDDDDEIRRSTRNLLLVANFNVLLASDGVEALKVLERQMVDALVIDVMMPRLDGVGVVRALVEMAPEQRPAVIIVISFHYELHACFAGLGVRRILPKPLDVPSLVDEIQTALNERSLHGF